MASTTPIIKIYNENNTAIQSTWNAGELDVSSSDSYESDVLVINIWNNKGGSTNVSNLIGCNITTKDINGEHNEQLVTEQWVKVCVDSTASTDESGSKKFSPVGYDESIGKSIVCDVAYQGATGTDKTNCTLKGVANTGVASASKTNYSKVSLKIIPGVNAIAAVHHFKTRFTGYYI